MTPIQGGNSGGTEGLAEMGTTKPITWAGLSPKKWCLGLEFSRFLLSSIFQKNWGHLPFSKKLRSSSIFQKIEDFFHFGKNWGCLPFLKSLGRLPSKEALHSLAWHRLLFSIFYFCSGHQNDPEWTELGGTCGLQFGRLQHRERSSRRIGQGKKKEAGERGI